MKLQIEIHETSDGPTGELSISGNNKDILVKLIKEVIKLEREEKLAKQDKLMGDLFGNS